MKLPKLEVSRGRWVEPDMLTPNQDVAATKILAQKGQLLAEMGPLVRRLGTKDPALAKRRISRLPVRVRRITSGESVVDIYFVAPVPLVAFREDKRHVEAILAEQEAGR